MEAMRMSDDEKLARAKSRAGRLLSELRWAGTTPEERSKFAAQVAAHRTPEQMGAARKDLIKSRCPCGEMTLARAKARRHKCAAPSAAVKKAPPRKK